MEFIRRNSRYTTSTYSFAVHLLNISIPPLSSSKKIEWMGIALVEPTFTIINPICTLVYSNFLIVLNLFGKCEDVQNEGISVNTKLHERCSLEFALNRHDPDICNLIHSFIDCN